MRRLRCAMEKRYLSQAHAARFVLYLQLISLLACLDRPVQDSPGGKARDCGIFHFSALLVPLLTEYVSRMSKNGIKDSSMIGIVPAVPGLP